MAGTRLAEMQEKKIQELVGMGIYISTSEFIREAVREKLESIEIRDLRKVSNAAAKKEVIEYLKENKKVYPSDIADALNIDIDLVLATIKELINEGRVKN